LVLRQTKRFDEGDQRTRTFTIDTREEKRTHSLEHLGPLLVILELHRIGVEVFHLDLVVEDPAPDELLEALLALDVALLLESVSDEEKELAYFRKGV
jgi:hypothetical protein